MGTRSINVRFTPESGHWLSASECPLCAKSGLMQCSKNYSMTWSANGVARHAHSPQSWSANVRYGLLAGIEAP